MAITNNDKLQILKQLDHINDIGELSDGYHTFNSLYDQRMYLFAALIRAYKYNPDVDCWKSKRHEDDIPCFDGSWFIVGMDTPKGTYTYHFKNEHFDLFDCKEIEHAKHWDGHTDKDVIRLLSLPLII